MKVFEINKDALSKCWESHHKWFSKIDYTIKGSKELSQIEKPEDIPQSTYLISIGFIPYVSVCDVEVMRAYCETIENAKLKGVLSKIDENQFEEDFWKYCNIYPEMAEGYSQFEDTYVINKIKNWCIDNGIEYTL